MTEEQKTELDILLDIVFEASKWKIEDGMDGIRLEVESRIRNLILTDKATVVSCQPEVSPVLTADDLRLRSLTTTWLLLTRPRRP